MKLFDAYQQSEDSLARRIGDMTKGEYGARKKMVLAQILGMIDLTTLEGDDTYEKVRSLCDKAVSFPDLGEGLPVAAAVCVYPTMVSTVKGCLEGHDVKVASVAGGFPAGQTSLKIKLEEVRYAVEQGADEIDTVISRGKLIEGYDDEVLDELSAIKDACGRCHLKVILETGELKSIMMIRKASEIAILAGADFIKTSTGKIPEGATLRAFLIMVDTVMEYAEKTGRAVGLKPAGGIRKSEDALKYYQVVDEMLGSQWLDPGFFRIGASSLADDLLNELRRF